jgi:hypothetical protein
VGSKPGQHCWAVEGFFRADLAGEVRRLFADEEEARFAVDDFFAEVREIAI